MVEWDIVARLMTAFPDSFINQRQEFIAHREANEYFILKDCETELDVQCKVLEWLSRAAYKSQPFGTRKNKAFHAFMLDGINKFLGTVFTAEDMEQIYTYLGNAVNHAKTVRFVESGYDMAALGEERGENGQDLGETTHGAGGTSGRGSEHFTSSLPLWRGEEENNMRDILFRGKRVDNGKWVEGYAMCCGNIAQIGTFNVKQFGIQIGNSYAVDPSTVGQYTGLTDKNGMKIFEGDIVRFQIDNDDCPFPNKHIEKIIGQVFYSDWRASFSVTMGENLSDIVNNDLYNYIRGGNRVEIIGNIHDNPELREEAPHA